jgi:hypothetical protein
MKNLLILFLSFISISSSAQIVSGIYLGKLVNDSTKKVQSYELALDEYRGKISGYSYTTFVSNDTFYYSIKKIKATRQGNELIVEDDKMIINNFPEAPAKKVHQINRIQLTNEDTMRQMNGKWETNKTKIYYALHGGLDMRRDSDSSGSALIAHLKELNILANDNYQNTQVAETKVKVKEDKTKVKKQTKDTAADVASTETKAPPVKETKVLPPKVETVVPKPAAPVKLTYDQRRNKTLQTVDVKSDSLILSFYDNGVVDGDSISVYLNGQPVVSNARLAATAMRKTISVKNLAEINLLLVAENLGTLPPNTGLLTIRDGDDIYQVNFSADLQTNAVIVIRRKQ